eukprot:1754699-Pleurochrysis_carterae.AAC.1
MKVASFSSSSSDTGRSCFTWKPAPTVGTKRATIGPWKTALLHSKLVIRGTAVARTGTTTALLNSLRGCRGRSAFSASCTSSFALSYALVKVGHVGLNANITESAIAARVRNAAASVAEAVCDASPTTAMRVRRAHACAAPPGTAWTYIYKRITMDEI